jgi:hypothetical protein
MRQKLNNFLLVSAAFLVATLSSCTEDEGNGGGPVGTPQISKYYPQKGGVATKVVIEGANFGTNPDLVRVWFNKKQAAVIGASGDRIYALVPARPGDGSDIIMCDVSIAVRGGKTLGVDSIVLKEKFEYRILASVSTVASKPNVLGDNDLVYEGTLAEVSYKWVNSVAVDKYNNVFVYQSWPVRAIMFNEEQNRSRLLHRAGASGEYEWQGFGEPNIDFEGEKVIMPNRGNGWDGGTFASMFYVFDPSLQWAAQSRSMIHPSVEQQQAGTTDFPAQMMRSSMCFDHDGNVWTLNYLGNPQLIKMEWLSRIAEVKAWLPTQFASTEGGQTAVSMRFHPTDKNLLFICYRQRHCIYTYNIETGDHTLWAGTQSVDGWRDGEKLKSEFNLPSGFCWDKDGNMYVADMNNHVIRKITPEGMVSTLVGKPNTSGYQDGNPDDALFRSPCGVAVGPNGDIYVADNGNMCIRKLTIQ